MKRLAIVAVTIVALIVTVYTGLLAWSAVFRHSLWYQLRFAGPIYRSSLQPGLEFFKDLDEVKFVCARSFDGSIEITACRRHVTNGTEVNLHCVQHFPREGPGGRPRVEEKFLVISEEVFRELQGLVFRQDLIDRSLKRSPVSTDGSMWLLEGKKGDLVISHQRLNPIYEQDKTLVAIGLRFFDLAGIKVPEKELY